MHGQKQPVFPMPITLAENGQSVENEPMFGIYAVPVDWPLLRLNLRIVKVHVVFCF